MIGVNKMFFQTTARLTLLSAALLSTGACTKKIAGPSDTIASEASQPSTVKTGAALDFSHRMQASIKENSSNSVTLNIAHSYSGENLLLTASSDDGLKLAAKSTNMSLAKGQNATWTIPFTTTTNGLYYINIMGTVKGADGNTQFRAYAVRVEVGDQSGVKKPASKEVILPAQEKISGK
jgi:hypothetical protein